MNKLLLAVLITPLFLYNSNAQTIGGPPADFQKMKGRELVVVLESEGKEENKVLNEYLKAAVKSNWDFTDEYIFIQKDKLGDITSTETIVMMFTTYNVRDAINLLLSADPLDMKITLGLYLSESFKPKQPAVFTDLVHNQVKGAIAINEKDIIYGVQRLHTRLKMYYDYNFLDAKEIKVLPSSLADKILLIDESMVSNKFNKEQIAIDYPFPFEIASNDMIVDKLKSKNEKYAYLGVRRNSFGRSYSFYVTINDCKNGELISMAPQHLKEDYKLGRKQVKEFVKYDKKYNR